MWTPFALLVTLLAVTSAEYGFKTGNTYKYEVTSKTLTSLQQVSEQYSGVLMRAKLMVTPIKDDELLATLTEPEMAQVHTTLPRGAEYEIPQSSLQFKPLTLSKEPFVIKLKEGVVDELVVSKELPVWEVNVIRSIVSQFQVDTQGRRLIPSKLNSLPHGDETTAVYKIMEDTVEGDCEVLYDITPLPKYVLQATPSLAPAYHLGDKEELVNILKTKNFTNCEQRPGYHFGFTGLTDWKPTTNKMGNFLSRSSVSRVVLSGSLKTYTIQSSVTTNKVILSPQVYNNQKGEVVSRVNLTLLSVEASAETPQLPQNTQTLMKLVYDFNGPFVTDAQVREKWDQRQEQNLVRPTGYTDSGLAEQLKTARHIDEKTLVLSNEGWYQTKPKLAQAPETPFLPYFVGYSGHSIQHSKDVNVNQVVRKMAEQIGQTLQDQTHMTKESTLEKFTTLTAIIRTMSAKQLEQTVQELYTAEPENMQEPSGTARNAWMVFRDALTQAGTGPALLTTVSLLTSHKIKGEEAAQVLSTMAETARYPTTEYMNAFFELVKNPEIVSQPRVRDTAAYSFTKLVRLALVNPKTIHSRYPVHAFGYLTRPDDSSVTTTYIPYFAQQLEQAVREGDSHKIQVYIKALANIAHPKILQVFEPYLEGKQPMSEFQRTFLVASLGKLAELHPKLARTILYKIYANTGESYQVRVAAVYNLMKTVPPASMLQRMAQFTHEDPSNQVRSAVKSAIESAAQLVSKSNYELRQNALSAVNMLVPKVYGVQYSRLNLTDYLVKGLHLGYTQTLQYIGSKDSLLPRSVFYKVLGNVNGYKTSLLKATSMVSSVQTLCEFLDETYTTDETEQNTEETHGDAFTVEKITKLLNLEHLKKEQVEGNFAFKLGNLHRFFAYDNHTIEKLPELFNQYTQKLAQGKVYNYQKFFSNYELTVGLPTATGFPAIYTLNTPIYVGVKGKVQVDVPEIRQTQKGFKLPETASLTTNVELTLSAGSQGQISFVTPCDHQRYIAGYKKEAHLNVPVKGSLSVDVPKRHLQLEVKPVEKRGDYKLFHYNTLPYTAVQDVVDFKPVSQGSNTKVMKYKPVKEFNEHYGGKHLGMVFRLEGKTEKRNVDLKKLVFDMLKRHNVVSGTVYPTAETSIDNTNIELYYDAKMSTVQSLGLTATYRKVTPKELKHETTEAGKAFTQTADQETRVKQFYQQAAAGIKGATAYVVDLGLKVQGQTPIQYVGTVAYARSPVDAPTKFLAYLHKAGSQNYEICYEQTVKDAYVSLVDYEKAAQTDSHTEVTAELKFGDKCESGAKVVLNGKLERTPERQQYLQNLPQVQKCKTELQQGTKYSANCRNATLQAGLMDKYRFTVKYDNVPDTVKNTTYQVYSLLRHFGYPYVTESLTTGTTTKGQQVELDVNFSPDLKTANLYVSAPVGDAEFRDVNLGEYVKTATVAHPVKTLAQRLRWTTFQQQYRGYCTIDKTQTKTFDNQTYNAHMGQTWHVMSVSYPKDKTDDKHETYRQFSVLVRDTASNDKEVQFNFNYNKGPVVTITPGQGNVHGVFSVNGQEGHFDDKGYYEYTTKTEKNEKVIFQAYALPTGELKFVAPEYGFELLYDQARVQLTLSPSYRNRVGGLCGVYNGERFNYVTPQGFILRTPEEFAATWALSSEGHVAELQKKAQEHSVYKKTVLLTNVVSQPENRYQDDSQEYDSSSEDNHSKCSTKRIMVIERDGKHCFSVHPQTACKPGCQVEKTRTMNAEFICVNKTQTSSHWAQMVARGAQPNFKNKANAQKMQFEGPEVCTEA